MKKIASGNNPHVVRLIGCVTLSEPHCLLTEYVCYGDLHSYLKSIKSMVSIICCHFKWRRHALFSCIGDVDDRYLESRAMDMSQTLRTRVML